MKHKLLIIALVVALLIVGVTGGSSVGMSGVGTGQNLPVPGVPDSLSPANASALSIEAAAPLSPAGTGFNYQGSLKDGGSPANGSYDFQFSLYDALAGGSLVSGPVARPGITVTDGLFTVSLDFGLSPFDGSARFLDIAVRQSGGGSYVPLTPRQEISPTPYALFAFKTTPYKNVVTVAQSGGQYTSIQAALNSITNASDTNRYLVWVGPGIYSERVTMKQYVDIEGAGENTTRITFTGSASDNTGTLVGASNAELRSLTVENTGGNNAAVAIYNGSVSPSLLHVTAIASGGSAFIYAVLNLSSSPNMTSVTAIATGSGVATNNYGVYNTSSSPNMTNVTAIASDSGTSSLNHGVANTFGASPKMTNVIATASGGFGSFGVYNQSSSSPLMTNVTIAAFGSTSQNFGVYNSSSSPKIMASTITANGGVQTYGITSFGTSTVKVDNSKVMGDIQSIRNTSGATTLVGASQLAGGPAFTDGSPMSCTASYDGNNKRLGSLCTPDSNVVYVAATGGDFTSIQAALNSISGASATNRYLVKVGPGTYTEQIVMKPYVDIEGAGEGSTRITFPGSNNSASTLEGANNAELRSLTVENTGGNTYAIAIHNGFASPSLLHVTAVASGGSSFNYGVRNLSSSATMNNVTASASSGSVQNYAVINDLNSSPNMTNLTATASGSVGSAYNIAVANYSSSSPRILSSTLSGGGVGNSIGLWTDGAGGTVTVDNSTISGITNSIQNGSGSTIRVGSSRLSGGAVFTYGGPLTCAGVYDENYTFFASTCP